jgi:hypothetical protein
VAQGHDRTEEAETATEQGEEDQTQEKAGSSVTPTSSQSEMESHPSSPKGGES